MILTPVQLLTRSTIDGVLRHIGHEHERNERIKFAQPARGLHSVDVRQAYVHHHDVVVRFVSGKEYNRIGKYGNVEFLVFFLGKPPEITFEQIRRVLFVFDYCYVNHNCSFPYRNRRPLSMM